MLTALIAPVALVAAPAPTAPALPILDATPAKTLGEPGRGVAPAPVVTLPVLGTAPQTAPAATPKRRHAKGDPLEGFNRAMFGIHQAADKAVLRPIAMGYKAVVPRPARSGLRNLLSNLTEPFVFLNFLLQARPGKAAETFARFAVNSTVGIAGLFDVAKGKDIRLPHRNNGFGATLAIYGIGPGPYLFLPFIGPATLRDFVGKSADEALLPAVVGNPFNRVEYQIATGAISGLDERAEADADLKALFADAVDPYATLRSVYLQDRAAEIDAIRGHHKVKAVPATPELEDPLADPAAQDAQQTPAPQSDAPELQDPLADPAG